MHEISRARAPLAARWRGLAHVYRRPSARDTRSFSISSHGASHGTTCSPPIIDVRDTSAEPPARTVYYVPQVTIDATLRRVGVAPPPFLPPPVSPSHGITHSSRLWRWPCARAGARVAYRAGRRRGTHAYAFMQQVWGPLRRRRRQCTTPLPPSQCPWLPPPSARLHTHGLTHRCDRLASARPPRHRAST